MARPAADRPLRRMVAKLARASEEDIQSVLAGLEEKQRETVEALLAAYRGQTPARTSTSPAAPAIDITAGLSSWLALRVQPIESDSSHPIVQMTPGAILALQDAAREHAAEGVVASPPPASAPFWGRFRDTLAGRGLS